MKQHVSLVIEPSTCLVQSLVPSVEEQTWWQNHLEKDRFSQAPSAWKSILEEMGERGKARYHKENYSYSRKAASYNSRVLKNQFRHFRNVGTVVHIGGGTGLGLGYAKTAWKLGHKLDIWDICDAGLKNSNRNLVKICKKITKLSQSPSACAWSLHVGDVGKIFVSPHGIDQYTTCTVIAEKVEQHRKLEDFIQDCVGMGGFLSEPGKVLIFAHPFGRDNPQYEGKWKTSHAHERKDFVQFLSEGAHAHVHIQDEVKHTYFDQTYTFFTAQRTE